ncbi:MAG: DUF929 family protein [Candidatus Micrarchaeaceae archaeon]
MKNSTLYIIIIVIVAAAVLAAYFNSAHGAPTSSLIGKQVPVSTLSLMKSIAMNSTLAEAIGSGSAGNPPLSENGTPLYVDNKPTVVYFGADYCPYCAVTRWGLILALMRFGNFTLLHYMQANANDPAGPNTPTFSFYNSSYSSSIINFMSVETLTRNETPLQAPNAIENATFDKYDLNNPQLPSSERGGIPFVDFGNKSVQDGAEISPLLIYKLSWGQILQDLNNPNSTVAQAIIGNANVFTAQICRIDNNTPANVCDQNYVKQILQFG